MVLYMLHAIIFSLAQLKEPSLLGVLPLNFWGDRKGRMQREVFGEKDSMQGSMMIGVYLLQLTIRPRYYIGCLRPFQKFEI